MNMGRYHANYHILRLDNISLYMAVTWGFGFCFMFMFSCLIFWSIVMVPVCVMLPLPSCIHAIGSLVHCVMF